MKSIILLIMMCILSLSAQAARDPEYCGGEDSCVKGRIPLLKAGTFHARAFGRTCEEAMRRSDDLFEDEFGKMSCGLWSGPYVDGCYRHRNGNISAWRKCSPDSRPARTNRPRCTMVGGILVC